MSAYSHRGHVYFAACGKYVKIGYTSQQPQKRIAMLPGKVRVPDDFDRSDSIWLMHAIPGCVMRDESRVHSLFMRYHAEGEWFHLTTDLILHLASLRYVTYHEERAALRRERAALRKLGFAAYSVGEKPAHGVLGLRAAS